MTIAYEITQLGDYAAARVKAGQVAIEQSGDTFCFGDNSIATFDPNELEIKEITDGNNA